MSFIREEALRLIQQQIFTCSQSGAKVQADLDNKSGDILVTLFDTSIIDATPYRVRIRFRISYLESEAETTVARIKVSTIAHELNRTALFEVHRQTNEDVWERMHPWQFAYDGTCTVKAPPYGAGVSAQDAAPFAQLVVSRSNRLTLQQDAVERCLRMLIDEHEVSSKIRTELFLRRKKLREESLAFREELLLCAVSILSCGDLQTVLNLSPVLLKLLIRESKARKLSKVMLSDQTTFPSREAMICRPIEGVLDIASAWAPLSVGKGRSPNQLRAMSGRKPDRRPRVEWNVVLEPVPIVIQGLGVIGRRPESTQSFFDETLEKDVNLLIKTATDDPRGENLVQISNKHVESIVPDSERDTLGKYCKELSSLCIIRTIHVPVPVPVVQVFYSDSSLHCFMERHHIMADMRHVENTAALREMDRSQFTLWDGTFCFDAVIDKSLKEPVHHDRPGSGETISRIASIYRPISDPIPRIARVSYRIAAGVFSTAQHVDLLQTWRSACLTRPKGIPKPWLEDSVFIDGLEDAHVPLGLDTESTVSLAMAIVDELATPVNLQKILHSSAYKFPSILTHEYLQEDGATSVEASRDYPVKIPENEANERYADEFNVQPVIEPIPVSTFAVLAGSKRAVQFKATVEKIKARNAMAHEIAADLSRKAYESSRPVPWRFSDESTSMTAGMWYTRDPEEGGIARGDPRWNMSPLSDSAKHGWGSKLCALIEQSVFQGNDSSKIPQKLLQACKNYSVAVCRRRKSKL
jgi:hypothetical protein